MGCGASTNDTSFDIVDVKESIKTINQSNQLNQYISDLPTYRNQKHVSFRTVSTQSQINYNEENKVDKINTNTKNK